MKKLLEPRGITYPARKYDLKMKLSLIFLLVSIFTMEANNTYSQNNKVTLNLKNVTVEEVIDLIEDKTEFKFAYKIKDVDTKRIVSVKANKEKVASLLKRIFSNTQTAYSVIDRQIFLTRKRATAREVSEATSDANILQLGITGTVLDADGVPLPGANVLEKGTTNGTQTDFDGNFSIELSDTNVTLVVSYIGFATKEIAVEGQSNLTIELAESAAGLDEVIVTGYTKQSRRLVTGAVETVREEELAKNPATNVEQQLQGKISGVNIVTSGDPSGSAEVRIRGTATLGTARDPLYIIDGAPSENLDGINPGDIATISVLKDASAASIYGARAANGVVLVTTKKGSYNQKSTLTYSSYTGVDVAQNGVDVLNAQQWGDLDFQGQLASVRGSDAEATFAPSNPSYITGPTGNAIIPEFINGDPSLPYNIDTNRIIRSGDTDWYDVVTRTAFVQNHNLSMRGGGESSRYALSFGYIDRDGTLLQNDFQRYTTRANTEFSAIDNRLRIGENLTVSYSELNGNGDPGTVRARYHPLIPRFDEGGNFAGTLNGILGLGTNQVNPEANQVRLANGIERALRVFGNAFVEFDIIEDLTIRSSVSVDYTANNNSLFRPENPEGGNPGSQQLEELSNFSSSLTWTNTLNYRKTFGDHSFDFLLGTEAIELRDKFVAFTGNDFFSEDLDFVSVSTAGNTLTNDGFSQSRNLASIFGKVDYNYKSKYLLNATVRRDGSSALGPNNRFDVFAAVGAGWVISEEDFLADSSVINSLKLRAGFGEVGNQLSLDAFDFVSRFSSDPTFRSTGIDITAANTGDPINGITLLERGNPDLRWETSETLNIGLDFALFDNKLTGALEVYNRKTKDLILQPAVPLAGGAADAPFINAGDIRNRGVDLSLTFNDAPSDDFNYSITGVFSTFKNEVLSLDGGSTTFFNGPGGNPNIIATRTAVGEEISAFFGLIVDGVLQQDTDRNNDGEIGVGEAAGNFNFRDLNGDGEINLEDDRDFIGSPFPDFTYSINFTANYRAWDFTAFFRGSQGNDIFSFERIFLDFQAFGDANRSTRALNAWRPDNPVNTLAEFNQSTADFNQQGSTYNVQDGSFFRLQTLQVGYSFPDLFGLDKFRVYVQGQNVFTITPYDGVDPEITENADTGLEIGVDRGATNSVPSTYILGLNLSF